MAIDIHTIVPPQKEGSEKNIEHTVTALDENDAKKLFDIARNRLVDINHWHEISNPAKFELADSSGRTLDRTAEQGDFFKINIHDPGPVEGRGLDWVYIEAVEEKSDPNGHDEFVAIRVRPAPSPVTPGDNVAHFFSDAATSSFVVKREEKKVTAAVYGRNESPNTETTNVIDKVRNAVVAVTAILGLSNLQWNSLVNGLLRT